MRTRVKYTVVYEHGTDVLWVASIPELAGCHAQGWTIAQARGRIREALALCIDAPSEAEAELVMKGVVFSG